MKTFTNKVQENKAQFLTLVIFTILLVSLLAEGIINNKF